MIRNAVSKVKSNAWDAWQWRKFMWLAIHDGAITLGVSLLSMENIANFEKFKQKTRHKY